MYIDTIAHPLHKTKFIDNGYENFKITWPNLCKKRKTFNIKTQLMCQSVNIRPTLLITIIGTWATLTFIILFVKIKNF